MNAEHRKDQKNSVVATLERVGSSLKEGPSRRTAIIVGIGFLVVLLFVVWKIVSGVSDSRNSGRWEQLYAAGSPDALEDLTEKNKNTVQGRAARLQVARQQLRDGTSTIFTSRDEALEKLASAAEAFEKLAAEFKSSPILVQECLFGAAQARETAGEVDRAKTLYADLAKRYPDSSLGKQAERLASAIEAKKSELDKIQEQLKK